MSNFLKTVVARIVADMIVFAIVMGILCTSVIDIRAEGEDDDTIASVEMEPIPEPVIVVQDDTEPVMVPVQEPVVEEEPDATIDINVAEEILAVRKDAAMESYYWAYIDPDTGERTDLSLEDMILVEDILNDKPAYVIFGIVMTESRADEDAIGGGNGIAQITKTTGKEIWTKMLNQPEETWDPSMLMNKEANLILACVYVDYLWDRSNSIEEVLNRYHGDSTDNYKKKVAKWLSYSDISFEDINAEYF